MTRSDIAKSGRYPQGQRPDESENALKQLLEEPLSQPPHLRLRVQ